MALSALAINASKFSPSRGNNARPILALMAAAGNMYSSTGGYGNTMTAIGKGINSHPTGISINLLAILDDSGIASQ